MDELISRQAAIDAIAELQGRAYTKAELKGISKAWKRIKQLPSAEPERKKGKWNTDKESPEYATCSVCGHCDWDCTESEYFNYCPNCGAEMEKGEDDDTD